MQEQGPQGFPPFSMAAVFFMRYNGCTLSQRHLVRLPKLPTVSFFISLFLFPLFPPSTGARGNNLLPEAPIPYLPTYAASQSRGSEARFILAPVTPGIVNADMIPLDFRSARGLCVRAEKKDSYTTHEEICRSFRHSSCLGRYVEVR